MAGFGWTCFRSGTGDCRRPRLPGSRRRARACSVVALPAVAPGSGPASRGAGAVGVRRFRRFRARGGGRRWHPFPCPSEPSVAPRAECRNRGRRRCAAGRRRAQSSSSDAEALLGSRNGRAAREAASPPEGINSMPRRSACASTRFARGDFGVFGAQTWRSLAAAALRARSHRPMPVFSFSSPNCIVTIPMNAKATTPIHRRPRIRRSSSRASATASARPTARSATRRPAARPAAARGLAGAGLRAGLARPRAPRRGARTAHVAPAAGPDARCRRRVARAAPRRALAARRRHAEPPFSQLAGRPQMGRPGARVVRDLACRRHDRARASSVASGSRPHTHTGKSGGQMQPVRALGQEALHAAILERVEGDRRPARRPRAGAPRRAAARDRSARARR